MKFLLKNRGFIFLWLIVGAWLFTAACATVPYTGRRQLLMVSQNTEVSMGYRAFEQVKQRSRPAQDPKLQEVVQNVGQRIAKAAVRPDFRWEFIVIENDRVANAFCLPGGKVGIYTGLFKYIKSDADLATVMAHETAHVLARHAGERLSQAQLANFGGMGLGIAMAGVNPGAGQLAMMGYNLGTQMGVLLPYNRKQEYEADRIGLILMAKAGYDPALAVDFWRRFATVKKDKVQPPAFLSSHPSGHDRIRAMEASLIEARRYYVVYDTENYPDKFPVKEFQTSESQWTKHQNSFIRP